ncbi:acetyl/propionyl/methylcrotonyl-CoA carboxylase subunit alpha [Winogradskya humida]|uniref:Acetyl-/propionyl-CoA carboxylase alpha subunit AccA2 n=1 Tax=Winogradskya humida TaxID=113566 RepID=A0ABQ4A7G7_9ACTN|nr:biotin carboxylase N-terminal domain-containing protein [Actinoplanes humidus]GIE26793.1 putative acetyl-/propionyl-CoA carboxylase alpha subunit AccA2 [Actinoplanes humidus]
MITSVLVANRGEIARRIFTTCHRRGLATVAVFSDPDADSPYVGEADSAVRLPGSAPSDTYLRGDLLVDAALRAGADAIHPGYGFLAENAAFARSVQAAGLTWIGPGADAISLMGSKIESKSLMAAAGVPVLTRLDPATITEADLPVMVKASAGGGGRGIRIVLSLSDLSSAIDEASREASSAFGDATVFCERYIATGHHIEVQIMADAHGTVWALGERECSLQRRHQKVIEEAPAPLVDRVGGDLRERLHAAGRDAAAAVGYVGAGTVEFLADDEGAFWFLEMNTRLQVEHPVTECVTGTDLVALQLDMAEGAPLTGPEPAMTGHAVEARLYAESPADDWRPQTGTVHLFDIPVVEGIRLDSGVENGTVIGTHYDGMLAKVISYAPTRIAAVRQLAATLRRSRIHGVTTNRDLLVGSLLHPTFLDGIFDTSFYAANPPASLVAFPGLDLQLAALIAALSDAAHERGSLLPGVSSGFRNIPVGYRTRGYAVGDVSLLAAYRIDRGVLSVPDLSRISLVSAAADQVVLSVDGVRRAFRIGRFDDHVVIDSPAGSRSLRRLPRFTDPSTQLPPGALTAPMPGTVVRIDVAVGETVAAGQPLVRLEAMKMEHAVHAPRAGVVAELPVQVGQQVSQGTPLAVVSHDLPT